MYLVRHSPEGRALVFRDNGGGSLTQIPRESGMWIEFQEWNAKQASPLDVSDRAPEPVPADPDESRLKALAVKYKTGTISNAEKDEAIKLAILKLAK